MQTLLQFVVDIKKKHVYHILAPEHINNYKVKGWALMASLIKIFPKV